MKCRFINSLLVFAIAGLLGCVGTVEDTKKVDKSTISKSVALNFAGISSCAATSHQSVDIAFAEASVKSGAADIANFVYQVFLNGNFSSTIASKVKNDLIKDSRGNYHLTVSGLSIGTPYTFNARVLDPTTGIQDNNFKSCTVTTLTTKYPIFKGLVTSGPYPGVAGQTSALITWNTASAAEYLLGNIPVTGYKIAKYNIYMSVTTDVPASMSLLTSIPEVSTAPVTQYQVGGLLSGQKYYFMVRAVDESNREDKNVIVLTATTSTPKAVNFAGVSTVTTPTNSSGYSALNVAWGSPEGDFNKFMIFAVPETNPMFSSSSIDPNVATFKVADLTTLTQRSALAPGLAPQTRYAVFVVACMHNGTSCSTFSGHNKKIIGTTTPPLAPFGGITAVNQLSGLSGLNNVTLSMNPPASDYGVCQGIKLYDKGNLIKSCSDPLLGATEPCYSTTPTCTSSSLIIGNLVSGTEYCFSGKIYEGSRTQIDGIVEQCYTVDYSYPIFQQPASCAAVSGGTKLKIDWIVPAPEGLFTDYLVTARKDDTVTTFDAALWWDSGRNIFEGVTTDTATYASDQYKFALKSKASTTHTIAGLTPDTNYKVMVKTYMFNSAGGGIHYYDKNATVLNCRTGPLDINFTGWKHILSLGPRINGAVDHITGQSTYDEDFYIDGTTNPTTVQFKRSGVEPETLQVRTGTDSKHYYPKVVRGTSASATSNSSSGIVQLIWNEAKTTAGKTIPQHLFDEGIATQAGDGYFVFRKVTPSASNDTEYESTLNQVAGAASGWVILNESTPIQINPITKEAIFTDYLPASFHPVHSTNGTLAFRDKANTGKVIWYTVRYKLQGKLLNYAATVNKDAILPVILPPANMVSIHHWMANRYTCEFYGKDFDKNNQYRCEYGGMGSVALGDPAQYYYDVGGHVIIDRFTLGCDFTRFNDVDGSGNPKLCRDSNSASNPLDQASAGGGQPYANQSRTDAEAKNGDCIGEKDNANRAYYPNGVMGESVYYNKATKSCYLRVSGLSAGPTFDQSAEWAALSETGGHLSLAEVVEPTNPTQGKADSTSETMIPPTIANEALGRIYPQNGAGGLRGIGAKMSSNDSSLPPFQNVTNSQAYYLCQSHAIQLDVAGVKSKKIRKRLPSSRENILASRPHPHVTAAELSSIENSANSFNNWYDNMSGRCNTGHSDYITPNLGGPAKGISMGGAGADSATWEAMTPNTGAYDYRGDTAAISGTEQCVSGQGLQDYVGRSIHLQDTALCQVNSTATNAICKIEPPSNTITDYEQDTGKPWPPYKYAADETSYADQASHKNSNGISFFWNFYTDTAPGLTNSVDQFGYPRARKDPYAYELPWLPGNYYYYPTGNNGSLVSSFFEPFGVINNLDATDGTRRISFVTGQPLICHNGQSFCHADDNKYLPAFSLPSQLAGLVNLFFETEYVPALSGAADEYFVRHQTFNNRHKIYGPSSLGWWGYSTYDRYSPYIFPDTSVTWVEPAYADHRFAYEWNKSETTVDNDTEIRCSVKVKLNLAGGVDKVDDRDLE